MLSVVPLAGAEPEPRNFKDGLRFWLGPRQRYDAEHPAEEYAAKIRAALPPVP